MGIAATPGKTEARVHPATMSTVREGCVSGLNTKPLCQIMIQQDQDWCLSWVYVLGGVHIAAHMEATISNCPRVGSPPSAERICGAPCGPLCAMCRWDSPAFHFMGSL
ncbi:hypothetical protein JZ751_006288 [Albula glossodonta]|uniref:Uncharacterized protein n=1 Tax=Albula glossodonta TaxID=121402 RepID=A0A8T2MM59_9TELE|nr:hypothetical protein JZ751_006288 [Albula glossodonta]